MWRMLQMNEPDDYVIATGKSHTLAQYVEAVFNDLGLDWQRHVRQSQQLLRPTDITLSAADPSKANDRLGWSAKLDMHDVIERMLNEALE